MKNVEDYQQLNENVIIEQILKDDSKIVNNGLFAYIPMRLSGLGIVERPNSDNGSVSLYDRDKDAFCDVSFMKLYANLPICITHPKIENEPQLLGFDFAELIVGNTIHSFLKDNEIWVIAKIWNREVLQLLQKNDFSTSPHFISETQKTILENGDIVLKEKPLIINHLAIVENGFWDKKSQNKSILIQGENMVNETESKADNTESKIDSEVESNSDNTESKADNETSEVKADETESKTDSEVESKTDNETEVKADDSDLLSLVNDLKSQIQDLQEQVAVLKENNNVLSDDEQNLKDEVIEAINDIADSSDFVEKIRIHDKDKANIILQNFLRANKKNISKTYHDFIDSIPNNAVHVAKEHVLNDLKNNLLRLKKERAEPRGWQTKNNNLPTFKFA